jgi:molybdate transport system permease protein
VPSLSPAEWQALELSLRVSVWNVVVSLPVAFAVAYVLARCRFPGRTFLNCLVHMPLVLPPVVTGYILLLLLGTHGSIGGWLLRHFGIVFAFRWTGAVIAAAVMGFPLMVRAIRLSLESVDPRLEVAASTLGASPLMVFLTVTLPLSLPGVVVGAILSFARGLGEFGATITFVSNIPGETRTLPIAIYTFLQMPGKEDAVIRLTALAVVLSLGALLISEYLSARVALRVRGADA